MSRTNALRVMLLACTALVVVGCMPKMTIEEMKASMPEKPVELERLNDFVGKWKFEGEATMAMLDEPIKMTGTAETKWEGDGWYTVSHNVMNMEHFGESKGLETWCYDSHAKKYRSTWVDTMGMMGTSVSSYDEKSGKWKMKSTSHGPWGKSTMKGWLKFTTPDTMEWWFAEHHGLMKVMEMTGTGTRMR